MLLGTGLTAIDIVVTLAELNWRGKITAISRSGLLPRPHFRGIAYPDYVAGSNGDAPLKDMVHLVQQHCQKLERMSQNPAIAIDKLRPHTQRCGAAFRSPTNACSSNATPLAGTASAIALQFPSTNA